MTFDIGLNEVCGRAGVRYVITKFSRMDSLPNFVTHGAPLRARESSALTQVSCLKVLRVTLQGNHRFNKGIKVKLQEANKCLCDKMFT